MINPDYRTLLEKKIATTFKEYHRVLTGSKLIDSWDKATSAIGLVGDAVGPFSGGLGYLVSAGSEISELIPKSIYSIYYGAKTKDLKAIPYWTAMEVASFIPYLGEAIDMSNIYVNRARKITKEKVKKEMRKIMSSNLESRTE